MKLSRFLIFLLVGVIFGTFGLPPAFGKEQFVAVVITGDLPRYREAHEAFAKILRTGLGEDRVKVYVQTPNPDRMSWANSVRKAVGVGADLIITYGAPVTLVAKKEAHGIPVLFADVYDPVALGIVKDLAVPGGEISGVSGNTPIDTLLKVLAEIRPTKSLGVLFSSTEEGTVLQLRKLEELSARYGYAVLKGDVKRPGEIRQALDGFASKLDCIYITESVTAALNVQDVMEFSVRNGIPVISQIPGLSDLGAFITLEADPVEQGQLLGVHALQVLNGQKIYTLPVRTPKKVSLVINLQVAEKLNIKVPFQALSMATRVIK